MANRTDLINQLAASMGATQFVTKSFEDARYDTSTGTLYCNGMVISASIGEKAINHFTALEKKCDTNDSAQREMAMIYRCAIEAIKMMENPKVKAVLAEENQKKAV